MSRVFYLPFGIVCTYRIERIGIAYRDISNRGDGQASATFYGFLS